MKKMFSLSDRYVNYIKETSEKLELTESDLLRRIIDDHMIKTAQELKENKGN